MSTFDLSDNVLDTRDLKMRLDELEVIYSLSREADDDTSEMDAEERQDAQDEYEEVREEHTMLSEFWGAYSETEWEYGCAMVNENYFTAYAEEMAGDLYGSQVTDAVWPFNHIDWDEAADALKDDYSEVELDGTTFYVR